MELESSERAFVGRAEVHRDLGEANILDKVNKAFYRPPGGFCKEEAQ